MTINKVKQAKCEHTFITKGSVNAFVRECTKCGYYTVHVG